MVMSAQLVLFICYFSVKQPTLTFSNGLFPPILVKRVFCLSLGVKVVACRHGDQVTGDW